MVPAVLRSGDAGEMVVAAWGKDEEGGVLALPLWMKLGKGVVPWSCGLLWLLTASQGGGGQGWQRHWLQGIDEEEECSAPGWSGLGVDARVCKKLWGVARGGGIGAVCSLGLRMG